MTLDECPTPLKKMISDAMREFKRKHECRPRVLAVFPTHVKNFRVDQWMDRDKKEVIERMMITFVREGAQAVALVTESWMVAHDPDNDSQMSSALEASLEGRLYQHPDRIEIVSVMYEIPGGSIGAISRILRNPDRLTEWQIVETSAVESVFGGEFSGSGQPRFNNIFFKATGRT